MADLSDSALAAPSAPDRSAVDRGEVTWTEVAWNYAFALLVIGMTFAV